MSEQKSFFTTLPGILSALATLITAVVGLIIALNKVGLVRPTGNTAGENGSPPQQENKGNTQNKGSSAGSGAGTHNTDKTNQPPRKQESPQEQTTDGWAIIGYYEQGTFRDLTLVVQADAPAIGNSYKVLKDFRLVQKQPPAPGERVITLGMVHSGDTVEVLNIKIEAGTQRVPVYAKLRAVLHSVNETGR